MLHLNEAMSSLEHPEVTVSFPHLSVSWFPAPSSKSFASNKGMILFCQFWKVNLTARVRNVFSLLLICFVMFFCCHTRIAVLSWRVLIHPTGKGCGRPPPSHLNARPVKVQHLGSHSLYTAHDLLLMAHQGDSQTHYIPKAETQRS